MINIEKWLKKEETKELAVIASGKRLGKYKNWEPFYIGTKDDPVFDERLTWEGQSNKMTQVRYVWLCLGLVWFGLVWLIFMSLVENKSFKANTKCILLAHAGETMKRLIKRLQCTK